MKPVIVIFSVFLATSTFAAENTVDSKDNTRFLKSGEMIEKDRIVKLDQPVSGGAAAADVSKKASQLSEQEIGLNLIALSRWSQASKYRAYFNLLPKRLPILENQRSYFEEIKKNGTKKFNPYKLDNDEWGITLVVKPGFENLPEELGIFVELDGIGGAVPTRVAELFSAGFANGLATRLILGAQLQAIGEVGTGELDGISIGDYDLALPRNAKFSPDEFSKVKLYENIKTVDQFDELIDTLLRSNDVQVVGMLWGWQAGKELEEARKGGDESYFKSALALLKHRFSSHDIGSMCSFTLNYLAGYSVVSSVRDQVMGDASATVLTPEQRIAVQKVVLSELNAERGVKRLTEALSKVLLAGFDHPGEGFGDRKGVITDFLIGWQKGTISATRQLYKDVHVFSFGKGYDNGYRDGYASGYESGLNDGYAVAYKQTWATYRSRMEELERDIAKYERRNSQYSALGFAIGVGVALLIAA